MSDNTKPIEVEEIAEGLADKYTTYSPEQVFEVFVTSGRITPMRFLNLQLVAKGFDSLAALDFNFRAERVEGFLDELYDTLNDNEREFLLGWKQMPDDWLPELLTLTGAAVFGDEWIDED